jgi:AcrR family transcriptional regulator
MRAAAVSVAREQGLSAVTFRSVADQLGIADRTVVYYFPTKQALFDAVVEDLGAELQGVLNDAFGAEPLAPDLLMQRAWPVLTTPEAEPVFRLFFELIGAAAARQPAVAAVARLQMRAWVDWLAARIDLPSDDARTQAACGIIARIDGALLLHLIAGSDLGDQAARELGIGGRAAGSWRLDDG